MLLGTVLAFISAPEHLTGCRHKTPIECAFHPPSRTSGPARLDLFIWISTVPSRPQEVSCWNDGRTFQYFMIVIVVPILQSNPKHKANPIASASSLTSAVLNLRRSGLKLLIKASASWYFSAGWQLVAALPRLQQAKDDQADLLRPRIKKSSRCTAPSQPGVFV